MLDLQIALVAHEANRALCKTMGDFSQPAWEDAPDWQIESAVAGVKAIREDPRMAAVDSHESWMKHKLDDGWTYGPVKDPAKKEHPCMVPYHELPAEQRAKDAIFTSVVKALLDA